MTSSLIELDSFVQDDFKTAADNDNVDEMDLNRMLLNSGGLRRDVGHKSHNMALGGIMWSIGYNAYGQHGNGTTNNVNKLTVHQWAKDLDIVKVVSNGMNSFILLSQSEDVFLCFDIA